MTGIAIAPDSRPEMYEALVAAVREAGGNVVPLERANALIWADPDAADHYPDVIERAPGVKWIQLPYAGVEPFAHHLDRHHLWTCGKGVYAAACAEWIMTALLAAFRDVPRYARATSWPRQDGRNLLGTRITVLGGGGIAEAFLRLIEPWGCSVTIVRRQARPVPGAARTVTSEDLHDAVADTDAVIVCLSLTDETRGIVDAALLESMAPRAWLLNVARGGHVVTDDLIDALERGTIAGAVLDVTDPEPLPDESLLWHLDNVLITPHVGNTPQMGLPLLAERVRVNVRRWLDGDDLVGVVDVDAGY